LRRPRKRRLEPACLSEKVVSRLFQHRLYIAEMLRRPGERVRRMFAAKARSPIFYKKLHEKVSQLLFLHE
jgi:hypothetical protein